jgi:class 3 adenylate cyclase
MPLYMDRHDLVGVTAEDVAEAHTRDLDVGPKHDVSFLSYWFDPDLGAAFCLARAPDAEHMAAAHAEAHGLIPNQIIDASEEAVLRFLGRVDDPADLSDVGSAFRTILFTDLEDSTALAQGLEPAAYMSLLKEHDGIIRKALVATRGREVKHTGDGIMASFVDVADALDGALAIQAGFGERIAGGGEPPCRVRIGMAAGEPVDHNDDLFGATVNLASRICDVARPGEVLVSEAVHELGAGSGYAFEGGETVSLKGFAEAVPVFRLVARLDERAGRQPTE